MKNRLILLLILLSPNLLTAGPILDLYNSGVDDTGTPLHQGDQDTHYSIISGPLTGTAFVRTSAGGFPIPPWIGDNSTSAWLSSSANNTTPIGVYTYQTTFTLSGLDVSTAFITGQWAADNFGKDILINGVSTGITTPGFSSFSPFNINSGFVSGINTLDFITEDTGAPGGFRVEMVGTTGTATAPAPGAFWLLGSGLIGLVATRRKRIKITKNT